ncbi:MFS transporter [Sphingobium sp. 3R8]|uniref:MFS transporter n=1 Tax=Sphingobium sp. 3R8 TaxID=2874921 RepID=UPI001CCDF686|nr:MFS transporter [Sphingobium sp. 3R8]MBZ9646899.1 MFS transporter [Sphingobium sp. 3R8]
MSQPVDGSVVMIDGDLPPPYRCAQRRWYVVAILCLLFAVSMVDRFILALLIDPLKADLSVSDTQLGLLMGVAFAVLYSVIGFPLAHLIDRHSRKLILFGGVMLWSGATILSALAYNYTHLFILRSGVAIGEAVLTPAAVSLIADMFDRRERALPTSIYMAVAGVMGTGAFALGGLALQFAQSLQPVTGLAPWRVTLMIVGSPGILIAFLIVFTLREPQRQGEPATSVDVRSETRAYVQRNWRFFLPFFIGSGILNILTMGLVAWFPALLARGYGLATAEAGYVMTIVGVPCSIVGSFLWPWVAGRLEARGHGDAMVLLLVACSLLTLPLGLLLLVAHASLAAAVILGVLILALSANTTLPLLVIQMVAPNWLRGRLAALELLAYNLIGLALGPVIVAWLGEQFPGNPLSLAYGLAITAVIAGSGSFLCFFASRTCFLKNLAAADTASAVAAHIHTVEDRPYAEP